MAIPSGESYPIPPGKRETVEMHSKKETGYRIVIRISEPNDTLVREIENVRKSKQ